MLSQCRLCGCPLKGLIIYVINEEGLTFSNVTLCGGDGCDDTSVDKDVKLGPRLN